MSDDITPALTDEEWEKQRIKRDRLDGGWWPDSEQIWAFPKGVRIGPAEEAPSLWVRSDDRHALAALALHEQPFGFSREDVELIRTARDTTPDLFTRAQRADLVARTEGLIARIAAMLPPEKP